MGWAEMKLALKAKVHETFALPAVYNRVLAGVVVDSFPIVVRLNNDVRTTGGMGTHGFMQMVQDVPKLRIDKADMTDNAPPVQQDTISIESEGRVFTINNINPDDSKNYYVVEVE